MEPITLSPEEVTLVRRWAKTAAYEHGVEDQTEIALVLKLGGELMDEGGHGIYWESE